MFSFNISELQNVPMCLSVIHAYGLLHTCVRVDTMSRLLTNSTVHFLLYLKYHIPKLPLKREYKMSTVTMVKFNLPKNYPTSPNSRMIYVNTTRQFMIGYHENVKPDKTT